MAGVGVRVVVLLVTTVVAFTAGSGVRPRQGECPVNDSAASSGCVAGQPHDTCHDDRQCPYGERCCSFGCGRHCIEVCPRPCGAQQECRRESVTLGPGFESPPVPPPTCVPISPCDNHPPCPYGQRCIIGYGGRPRCVPLKFVWKPRS